MVKARGKAITLLYRSLHETLDHHPRVVLVEDLPISRRTALLRSLMNRQKGTQCIAIMSVNGHAIISCHFSRYCLVRGTAVRYPETYYTKQGNYLLLLTGLHIAQIMHANY